MGIMNRIWSKDTNSENLGLRLAARLEALSNEQQAANRDELQSEPQNESAPASIRQVDAVATVEETQDQPDEMISGTPSEPEVSSDMLDSLPTEELPEAARDSSAIECVEENGKEILSSVQQALADLQIARQEFEVEIRDRLESAISEHERQTSSPTPAREAREQLERATQDATRKIFLEAREQAQSVLGAVNAELRTFREQFGKQIDERVSLCDRVTQQALEVNRRVEDTLPQAREVLRSLPLATEEATAQVQAVLADSRMAFSEEIESQKKTLQILVQDCRQGELRLKERIEKFEKESGAACDLLGRIAEECFGRLQARADEIDAQVRAGAENLAIEIEQRILSGGLIETVLERIRNAGAKKESAAKPIDRSVHEVVGRLNTTERQIASRLPAPTRGKQRLPEPSMRAFNHNAAVELGNLIERVVAQSSQQLDARLHSLSNGSLTSANDPINRKAHSTLGTVHEGMKGGFEPSATQAEVFSLAR